MKLIVEFSTTELEALNQILDMAEEDELYSDDARKVTDAIKRGRRDGD